MAAYCDDEWADKEAIFGEPPVACVPHVLTRTEVEDPLRMVKVELAAILVGEQEPVTANRIAERYLNDLDSILRPEKYGFRTRDELLLAMPDIISPAVNDRGHIVYMATASEKLETIHGLVQRQKTSRVYHSDQRYCNRVPFSRVSVAREREVAKSCSHESSLARLRGKNEGETSVKANIYKESTAQTSGAHGSVNTYPENVVVSKNHRWNEISSTASKDKIPSSSLVKKMSHMYDVPVQKMSAGESTIFKEFLAPPVIPLKTVTEKSTNERREDAPRMSSDRASSRREYDSSRRGEKKNSVSFADCAKEGEPDLAESSAETTLKLKTDSALCREVSRYSVHSAQRDRTESSRTAALPRPVPSNGNAVLTQMRSAVEADLHFLHLTPSVTSRRNQHFTLCAPLRFVPPRCVLLTSIEGNESGERAKAVHLQLEKYFAEKEWSPLQEVVPGVVCVVRTEGLDYMRCVVVGKASDGIGLICCCLDVHSLVECERADVAELPPFASPHRLVPSTFLARLRGIDSVPEVFHNKLQEYCANYSPGCCTATVFPTLIFGVDDDGRCIVDWVLSDEDTWVSHVLSDRGIVNTLPDTADPRPPSAREALRAVERLRLEGFFNSIEDNPEDVVQHSLDFSEKAKKTSVGAVPPVKQESEQEIATRPSPCSEIGDNFVDYSVPVSGFNPLNFYQTVISLLQSLPPTHDPRIILYSSITTALNCKNGTLQYGHQSEAWQKCIQLLEKRLAEY